jgi:S1-C subfamily serine protease
LAFTAGWLWAPYLPSMAQIVSSFRVTPAAPEEEALAQVYQKVLPSVVRVKGTGSTPLAEAQPLATPVSALPASPAQGQGSGFVWDKTGHIVTNLDVVQAARCIEVILADGTEAGAEMVGRDISTNLAVLKVNLPPDRLHPVTLNDSAPLEVDQPVLAISAPPGQASIMMNGLISSLDRTMDGCASCYPIAEVIQVDIALTSEDSGGPLFNEQGEVIGINTWIISRGGTGISFALPGKAMAQLIPALIDD